MDQQQIVVSRAPGDGGRVRTGALLARRGSIMTVRWDDDGREEDVRITPDATFVVPGTLRHQAFADPDGLKARLETEPTQVFVQVLREYGPALSTPELKAKLSELRVEQAAVDKAWKRAQSKIKDHEHVDFRRGKYKWRAPRTDQPEQPDQPASPEAPAGTAQARPAAPDVPPEPAETPQSMGSPSPFLKPSPRPAAPPEEAAPAETVPEPEPEEPLTWQHAFAAALGDTPLADETLYSRSPLATALRLDRLDDAAIERLLAATPEGDRPAALAQLAAVPRDAEPVTAALAGADPVALRAVMTTSADELRRRPADPALGTAAVRFLDRLAPDAPDASLAALIRLAAAVTEEVGKDALDVLDRVAKVVGERLAAMPEQRRGSVDLDAVSRMVAGLPFTPRGGRATVLAAVGRAWPERVTEEIWWRGATLTALAQAAAGPLGGVTSRPEVARKVLAPLAEEELPKVTSRVRLAALLGLPTEFVRHLPPTGVASAFRRIAAEDPIVEAWLPLLAQNERVARLQEELEQAKAELRQAESRQSGERA